MQVAATLLVVLMWPGVVSATTLWEQLLDLGKQCAATSEKECGRLLREFGSTFSAEDYSPEETGWPEPVRLGRSQQMMMMMSPSGSDAAIVWLAEHQNESGSWGPVWFGAFRPTTELRDTSIALEALAVGGGKYRNAALAFLGAQNPQAIDYLSRTARARALAGQDMAAAFTAIKAARSTPINDSSFPNYPNRGWGTNGASGESNALDTALALHALAGIGIPDPMTSDGVIYLLACQNPDGGFGLQPPRESSLFVTLWSILALGDFAGQPGAAAAIQAGADYVELHQYPSGGIGETSGTITAADTALGKLVLGIAGRTTEAASAGTALLAMQAGDGSWNQDPYATGLAVVALPEPGASPQAVSGLILLALLARRRPI